MTRSAAGFDERSSGSSCALAGVAAAVAATGGTTDETTLVTALGGFATSPSTETVSGSTAGEQNGVLEWPTGQNGWTIALATLPQSGGKQPAVGTARSARKAGLQAVGILDTSQYASLHPGYWLVFTGNYTSEAEATSALQAARSFARTPRAFVASFPDPLSPMTTVVRTL